MKNYTRLLQVHSIDIRQVSFIDCQCVNHEIEVLLAGAKHLLRMICLFQKIGLRFLSFDCFSLHLVLEM